VPHSIFRIAMLAALLGTAVLAHQEAAVAAEDAVATLERGVGNDLVVTVRNTGTVMISSVGFAPSGVVYQLSNPRPTSCVTPPREPGDEDLPNNVICGNSGLASPPTQLIQPGGSFAFTVTVNPRYPDGAGGTVFYSTSQDNVSEFGAVAVTGPTAPVPVLGRLVAAQPLRGQVFVSLPGSARASAVAPPVPGLKGRAFAPLRLAGQIPVRSLLDTRRGTVRLTSAQNARGRRASAEFRAGVFQVLQSRAARARGLTELRLKGASFRSCRSSGSRASNRVGPTAARARRTIRRLRGRGRGRFRVRGRYSAATVRGTDWTVSDRCDGTLTKVRRGKVAVRDFRRKRTVLLRAGRSYLAKR
jgi:hypothetical protein